MEVRYHTVRVILSYCFRIQYRMHWGTKRICREFNRHRIDPLPWFLTIMVHDISTARLSSKGQVIIPNALKTAHHWATLPCCWPLWHWASIKSVKIALLRAGKVRQTPGTDTDSWAPQLTWKAENTFDRWQMAPRLTEHSRTVDKKNLPPPPGCVAA